MDGLLSNQSASPQKAVSLDNTSEQSAYSASTSQPNSPAAKVGSSVGSSIATLWLKISQENQPPASIPSTLIALSQCPECEHPLAPPLQSSGRQVCMKCGWTNKPRYANSNTTPVASEPAALDTNEPTDIDLLNLLEKAASESRKNMEPRKKPKH